MILSASANFSFKGVFAVSTTTLAKEVPSAFFRVLGTIFSIAEVLLWMVVGSGKNPLVILRETFVNCSKQFLGTLYKAWTGEMFFAPCLKNLDDDRSETGARNVPSKEIETEKQQ
jgi:hypothetical protein